MAQPPELKGLLERRRQLVARSDELRSQLADDFGAVKTSAVWVERGYSWIRSGRAIWPLLAGAAGLALAFRKGGWLGAAEKMVSVFRFARRMTAVIRTVLESPPVR